jgi:hypothetical protein
MNNSINIDIYSSWNIIWINVMEHLLYLENYKNYFNILNKDTTSILDILEQKINLNINKDITQGLISLLNIIVEYFYFDKKPFKPFLNDNMDLLNDIFKLFKKHFDMSHIIDNQLKLIISVPSDISNKIWTNIYGYKYKIVDWINPHTTFDWILPLNKNPHIIDFIKYKIDNFDLNSTLFWENLTENEYAIDLILDNWHLIPEKQEYERFYDLNSLTGHYEDNFESVENYNYFWHCLALNTNDKVIDIIYEYYDFINKTSDLVISLIEREIKITNLNDSLNKQEHIIIRGNVSLHLIEKIINENFREVSNIMLWSKLALINNEYAIKILLNNNATLNIDILTGLFINSNKIAYKIFVDIVINNDISGYQVSIDKYNLLDVIKYYNEHYDSYDKYYQIFDNDNIVNLLIDKYEEYKSSNDYMIFIAQHHNDKIVNLIIKNYQNIINQSNKFIKYFAMNKNILAVKFLLGIKNILPVKFWTYFAKNKNVIAIEYILENFINLNNLDFWNNLLLNDEEQIDDTGIIDLISKNWDDIFQVIKQNFINGDNLEKSKKFLENLAINKRAIKLVENNFLDILELIGKDHFYNVFLMFLYKNPNILIKDNSLNKYMENIYMIYETILYS